MSSQTPERREEGFFLYLFYVRIHVPYQYGDNLKRIQKYALILDHFVSDFNLKVNDA